jgi:multiple sugar transport system permease protein
MPDRWPQVGPAGRDWQAFIQGGDALDHVEIDSFEFRYRDFLRDRYGSLDALNRAHGEQYGSFEAVPLRLEQYDAWLLRSRRGEVVWEFLSRNYLHALDYLLLRGRAFWVTLVYCVLNVLGHLIVNPLAAYTLSRYRLRQAHWVLLFCLVTMAFPAEVGSIPRFLLIREMGLLNTLGALILPGLAHGFSIFNLKGFFDGLPKELYEAAVIEGAPERWMFWNVTLSLTKPILAVTAFGSFLSAYGAFMFALMICPDKRMWTISVWLYQFQQGVTEPVAFAALALASVPVLAAFLLAQKFIIQGIVLPVEK